jgi:mono/diheme cytochrome c family protein
MRLAGRFLNNRPRTTMGLFLFLVVCAATPQTLQIGDGGDGETAAKFSPQAAVTFNTRGTACHTYGKGIKVGPDLKGVGERRKLDWLLKFVHASSAVIKSGDPTATALFAQFKQQRMPDWIDLSDEQIHDILDYIAVGGPDIKPADERNADTATAAEKEAGRKLFYGETRTKYDARACVTCHSVLGAGLQGGVLGPDLTSSYLRYQDLALTEFLRHPCFNWRSQAPEGHYLSAKESFALKAFLREVAFRQKSSSDEPGSRESGQANRSTVGQRRTPGPARVQNSGAQSDLPKTEAASDAK